MIKKLVSQVFYCIFVLRIALLCSSQGFDRKKIAYPHLLPAVYTNLPFTTEYTFVRLHLGEQIFKNLI